MTSFLLPFILLQSGSSFQMSNEQTGKGDFKYKKSIRQQISREMSEQVSYLSSVCLEMSKQIWNFSSSFSNPLHRIAFGWRWRRFIVTIIARQQSPHKTTCYSHTKTNVFFSFSNPLLRIAGGRRWRRW